MPESDLRRFDAIRDPLDGSDLIKISLKSAREQIVRIRTLVEEAEEARPPLILGVGAQGQSQLEGIGYTGKDDE